MDTPDEVGESDAMTDAPKELLQIVDDLNQLAAEGQREEVQQPLDQLKQAAEEVEKAWSGSWYGYHANVYYRHLRPPPSGAYFSLEYGLGNPAFDAGTRGDWVEYVPEEVEEGIRAFAGNPDLKPATAFRDKTSSELHSHKLTILSIIELELSGPGAAFVSELKEQVANLSPLTESDLLGVWRPAQIATRDRRASLERGRVPPHFATLARIGVIKHRLQAVKELSELTRQLANHLERRGRQKARVTSGKRRVFVGHGRSLIWRELKDFIEDRLELQVDEFNRVSAAGMPTTDRLFRDDGFGWHGVSSHDWRGGAD